MLATLDTTTTSGNPTDAAQILPLQPHINGNLNGMVTPGHDPFNIKPARPTSGIYSESVSNSTTEVNGVDWETPTANGSHGEEDVMMDESQFETEAPHAPARRTRGLYPFQSDSGADIPRMRSITTRSRTKAGSETSDASEVAPRPTSIPVSYKRSISGQVAASSSTASLEPPGAPARRSDRLLRNRILPSGSRLAAAVSRDPESKEKRELRRAKATGTKGKSTSTVGRVVSGNRKPPEYGERDGKERPPSVASTTGSIREARKPAPPTLELSPHKDALLFLLEQYSKIGQGYLALTKYDCQVALSFFDLVVPAFRETPWVLAQIGRAYFEKSSYAEAEQVFAKIKKIAPSRTEDMEIYSTVLWHLKKDVDLAYISHELIETDRLSPQAWCALGNAFSLQGEHDQAVKCFKRATQLDPKFAYAFTLSGHEHVANEEFEKALHSFRHAISADHRHYNGWYGLGQVFEKLGKYDIAREHYSNAAKINPTNPVLKVCIGLVSLTLTFQIILVY
jgi:anaphase-promoting complex subunit 3